MCDGAPSGVGRRQQQRLTSRYEMEPLFRFLFHRRLAAAFIHRLTFTGTAFSLGRWSLCPGKCPKYRAQLCSVRALEVLVVLFLFCAVLLTIVVAISRALQIFDCAESIL